MDARLAIISPVAGSRQFKLALPTTIGRSREAKLKLVHGQISRLHCEIFEQDGMLYVRDLDSTNGTFVDDERVIQAAPLPPGATLLLGSVALHVLYGDADEPLLPPGSMATTDTVRIAPQEETFRAAEHQPFEDLEMSDVVPVEDLQPIDAIDAGDDIEPLEESPEIDSLEAARPTAEESELQGPAEVAEEEEAVDLLPLEDEEEMIEIIDVPDDEPDPVDVERWHVPEERTPRAAMPLPGEPPAASTPEPFQPIEGREPPANEPDDDLDNFLKSFK